MNLHELPFLGEYIKEHNIKLKTNTMVVAPTGAGKTHMIFSELLNDPTKKYLYLCDNINLTEQTLKEDNTFDFKMTKSIHTLKNELDYYEFNEDYLSQDEYKRFELLKDMKDKGTFNMSIAVMTYACFGEQFKLQLSEQLKEYDMIICDEIHNLFLYEKIGKNGNSNLAYAIENLFMRYRDKCIYFSATPQIVNDIKEKGLINPKTLNFYDKVREYTFDLRQPYYFPDQLFINISRLQNYFKNGKKALIYTNSISRMKEIENKLTNDFKLNCCCIWSTNQSTQKKYPFNKKQIEARKNLIKYGMFPNDVNVMIINNAMETGINIYDELVQCVFCDTTNPTQQIQARGRVRHNIIHFGYMTSTSKSQKEIQNLHVIPNQYLNRHLSKEELNELLTMLDLRNRNGSLIGVSKFKTICWSNGYIFSKKRIRIGEKLIWGYMIECDPLWTIDDLENRPYRPWDE